MMEAVLCDPRERQKEREAEIERQRGREAEADVPAEGGKAATESTV